VDGSVPEGYPLENSNVNELESNESTASDTGMGTAGIILTVLTVLVMLGILGKVLMIVLRRRRQHAETHVTEQTKSSDGNLHDADGENLDLPAPQTFESDDTDLQPSESAEMA
jgi:predicted metalloprotease